MVKFSPKKGVCLLSTITDRVKLMTIKSSLIHEIISGVPVIVRPAEEEYGKLLTSGKFLIENFRTLVYQPYCRVVMCVVKCCDTILPFMHGMCRKTRPLSLPGP